jgi:DNA-binding transcriptional LysR family regulator
MELRHLRYFVAIAEERSFTRAAERLWVAQPGLSTQIRRLESELGVQLLERHRRGVDLTAAGELFLERARVALTAADAAALTGRDLEAGVSGSLKIGLSTGPQWGRTPLLLERFTTARPGVELTVVAGYGGTLWRDLRDARLDAVLAPASFCSGDLRSLDLGLEPWLVLVGAPHPLAGDGPLTAEALRGQPVGVTGHRDGSGYDLAVVEVLAELGVTAALVTAPPGPALDAALARGAAVALTTAPSSLAPGVTARPLMPARLHPFRLLWRYETPSPALDAFLTTARECVGDQSARRSLAAVA